jgi:hypothetical protein
MRKCHGLSRRLVVMSITANHLSWHLVVRKRLNERIESGRGIILINSGKPIAEEDWYFMLYIACDSVEIVVTAPPSTRLLSGQPFTSIRKHHLIALSNKRLYAGPAMDRAYLQLPKSALFWCCSSKRCSTLTCTVNNKERATTSDCVTGTYCTGQTRRK